MGSPSQPSLVMLKAKNLNALLSQNTSAQVTHIFVFAPPCALIAYSSPASPMGLRMQATLAANVWSSYSSLASTGTVSAALPRQARTSFADSSPVDLQDKTQNGSDDVKYLALEFTEATLSIHRLQSGLLLCLAGPSSILSDAALDPSHSSPASQGGHLPNGVGSASTRSDTAPSTSQTLSSRPAEHGDHEPETTLRTSEILRIRAEALAACLDEELAMFHMPKPN